MFPSKLLSTCLSILQAEGAGKSLGLSWAQKQFVQPLAHCGTCVIPVLHQCSQLLLTGVSVAPGSVRYELVLFSVPNNF